MNSSTSEDGLLWLGSSCNRRFSESTASACDAARDTEALAWTAAAADSPPAAAGTAAFGTVAVPAAEVALLLGGDDCRGSCSLLLPLVLLLALAARSLLAASAFGSTGKVCWRLPLIGHQQDSRVSSQQLSPCAVLSGAAPERTNGAAGSTCGVARRLGALCLRCWCCAVWLCCCVAGCCALSEGCACSSWVLLRLAGSAGTLNCGVPPTADEELHVLLLELPASTENRQ